MQDAERVVVVAGKDDELMVGQGSCSNPNEESVLRCDWGRNEPIKSRDGSTEVAGCLRVDPPPLGAQCPSVLDAYRHDHPSHILKRRLVERRLTVGRPNAEVDDP